ncbi:MAG: hypothetical protein PHY26_02625 [Bacilli bacterium]|nr:hypothetical protein [Bacilli bacterium]
MSILLFYLTDSSIERLQLFFVISLILIVVGIAIILIRSNSVVTVRKGIFHSSKKKNKYIPEDLYF